jgi:hypothetical protein
MSWNNVLPMWVWEATHEHFLAQSTCCFEDEWFAGTSKVLPKHVIAISKATFKTHDEGGWNSVQLQVR